MIKITPIDPLSEEYKKLLPGKEDTISFLDAVEPPSQQPSTEFADMVSLLREAQDKHLPVMIVSEDQTRAFVIKDANMLHCRITLAGEPILEL